MQSRSIDNRLRALEAELSPEEVAEIGKSIFDRVFNKELTTEEANEEIESFQKRYVDPMDYRTWVKFMLKKNELEENRWAYTYFKEVVVSLDYKIAFLQQSLALIIAYQSHEDYISSLEASIPGFKEAWLKHCEKHPEDKHTEEMLRRRLERFYKLDIGEFMDKMSELEKQKEDILNWEGWEKMGYPKPSSVFEISPQSEQKE